jgi:hypothetical protein
MLGSNNFSTPDLIALSTVSVLSSSNEGENKWVCVSINCMLKTKK